MEIEETAKQKPEAIKKIVIDPMIGVQDYMARYLLSSTHQDLMYVKQLDGTTEEILPQFDIRAKFEALGFEALRVKGNDINGIHHALTLPIGDKPRAIVLDNVKGLGVKAVEEMEFNHSVTASSEIWDDYIAAVQADLDKLMKEAEKFETTDRQRQSCEGIANRPSRMAEKEIQLRRAQEEDYRSL